MDFNQVTILIVNLLVEPRRSLKSVYFFDITARQPYLPLTYIIQLIPLFGRITENIQFVLVR